MVDKRIAGWGTVITGIVLELFSIITIITDMNPNSVWEARYTYTEPFTIHEQIMIAIAIIAPFVIIIGISVLTSKNKE